jgi:hypothetical protein
MGLAWQADLGTRTHRRRQAHQDTYTVIKSQVACFFFVHLPLGIAHAASKCVRLALEGLLATRGSAEERHAGGLTMSHSRPGYLYKPVCINGAGSEKGRQAGNRRQRARARACRWGRGEARRRDASVVVMCNAGTQGRLKSRQNNQTRRDMQSIHSSRTHTEFQQRGVPISNSTTLAAVVYGEPKRERSMIGTATSESARQEAAPTGFARFWSETKPRPLYA